MKFQKWEAFEKHFEQAFLHHLSPIYLIVSSHPQDRKKILSLMKEQILKKEMAFDARSCVSLQEALAHVQSSSLLNASVLAVVDFEEGMSKDEILLLEQYAKSPLKHSHLIIGAAGGSSLQSLYEKIKKESIMLDLGQEKPWDRQDRLKRFIALCFQKEGKSISSKALDLFFQRLSSDWALLEQEMLKLICYAGARAVITEQDIQEICAEDRMVSTWNWAEQLIWHQPPLLPEEINDTFLFSVIPALRFNLERGLNMSSLIKQGATMQEIAQELSDIKPAKLKLFYESARKKPLSFFKQGLQQLFTLELSAKNSGASSEALLTAFYASLTSKPSLHNEIHTLSAT